MRFLLSAAFLLSASAYGQVLNGTYKPAGQSVGGKWEVNSHAALLWDGSPYLPIGIDVDATPKAIAQAKNEGFGDVLVDLPAADEGWSDALKALEKQNLHYVIRINSLTPMAHGIAVDPAAYRITDVKQKRHLDIPMPDTTEALVVVADRRSGDIDSWNRVPVSGGRLSCDVVPGAASDGVVLIYPQTVSLQQPDYWEGMDDHRDRLLTTLRRNPTGAGLRGFVNPLGRALALPGKDLRFVPNTPAFKQEFTAFLDARYRNVLSALRAWGLPSDVVGNTDVGESKDAYHNFGELTAFVPLWSGTRGVNDIWDSARNKIYHCERGSSTIWKDLADAIATAEARRFSRMVSAIREISDVPVIQDWAGWAPPYETADPTVDGIGMKSTGTSPTSILATAAKASSSMLRWTKPGWLAATEIDLGGAEAAPQVSGVLDDLTSLGARGVFFRTEDPSVIKAIVAEKAKRDADTSIASISPQAVFYPENATNPANTQRLPGGKWWLPSPADGNRIDYGHGYYGYRMTDRTGPKVVIWTRKPGRILVHFAYPAKAVFTTCDGTDVHAKLLKTGVELDLSEAPLTITGEDEIPVPDPAYQAASAAVGYILDEAKDRHMAFEDEQMDLTDAYKSFDRNPGASFLRIRQVIHKVDSEIGDFSWIEAEKTDSNNFSEVVSNPGCSGGASLTLHSSLETEPEYFSDYSFDVHSTTDQQLWMAARIPPDEKGAVTVKIGTQTFVPEGEPIGLYANGFGWYHLGVTRLLEVQGKLHVLVAGGNAPDLAIDAFALTPSDFKPDGVGMPDPNVVAKPKTTKKGSRKRGGG